MKKNKLLGYLLIFGFILLGWKSAFSQTQLKRTNTINACVREYVFGTPSTEEFVIVAFTCNNGGLENSWRPPQGLPELTEILVIAGGGGGGKRSDSGNRGAGGGGAGQVIHITNPSQLQFQVNNSEEQGQPLSVFIGSGGLGATLINIRGANGQNSRVTSPNPNFNNITALGGGGGGSANSTTEGNNTNYIDQRRGNIGGSGGGSVGSYGTGASDPINGGEAANSSFGNPGGSGRGNNSVTGGGGGGGIGGSGSQPANNNSGGPGGSGRGLSSGFYTNLLPTALPAEIPRMFGGGGGGVAGNPGSGTGDAAPGGSGVGGNAVVTGNGMPGVANTGSGGGAGGSSTPSNTFIGGRGGSGIVLIRYDFARILPVEYGSFDLEVNEQNRTISLKWSTLKEYENDFFQVERSSNGVDRFEAIGTIQGQGWTTAITNYEFVDEFPPLYADRLYYRLVQVDFSGKMNVGKVLLAKLAPPGFQTSNWSAFPNPVRGSELRVSPANQTFLDGDGISVQLTHSSGRYSSSFQASSILELNRLIQQELKEVPAGVFLLKLTNAQNSEVIRILKE